MQDNQINWEQIRSNYPLLDNKTYFNSAALGAMSRDTVAVQQEVLRRLSEEGANLFPEAHQAADKLRNDFLKLTAANHHEAAIIPDVSTAMNQIAENLSRYDGVALLEGDFASMTLPWMYRDFELSWIEKTSSGYHVEEIEKILKNGVDILSISWVIYNSGQILDISTIAQLCKKYDTIFVLDATQGLGVTPLSLEELDIDVVLCSCFKWFLSGFGIGMIIATQNFLNKYPFDLAGQNSVKNVEKSVLDDSNIKSGILRMELGHIKHQQVLALAQSFSELETIGFEAIQERTKYIMEILVSKFEQHDIEILTPTPRCNQIVMIAATEQRVDKLAEANVLCTSRNGVIRFSPYFYTNENDIERLIACLK